MQNAPIWLTRSKAGLQVLERLRKSALTPLSLYLQGETGVGKEILARLAHNLSAQATGPYVPLHCAALSPHLAESELFGHVRGAFTGAQNSRKGALQTANQGTLFLDEVGELPPEIQVKLLRFLESGEIRPVGSDHTQSVQVRVICATHKNLRDEVRRGHFREDLYYRLAAITLEIPPLRARRTDIAHQARAFASELGYRLPRKTCNRLRELPWYGNSRELKRAVERAAFLSERPKTPSNQAPLLLHTDFEELQTGAPVLIQTSHDLLSLEKTAILGALAQNGGNRASAARDLGIARSTLFERMRRHGIRSFVQTEQTPPKASVSV